MDSFVDAPKIEKIEWWVYIIIVCTVFTIALALNYIVKMLNDVRLEKRIRLLRAKPSVSQSIQYKPDEPGPLTIQTPNNHAPGQEPTKNISLVFNQDNYQEDNRRKEVINDKRRKEGEANEDEYNTMRSSDRIESSHDEYLHSVPVSNRSSPQSTTTIEEVKPAFLGKIYKDLHNKTNVFNTQTSTSKNISNSRESISMKTGHQIKDKNNKVKHGNADAIGSVRTSNPSDNDSILNDILDKVGSQQTG